MAERKIVLEEIDISCEPNMFCAKRYDGCDGALVEVAIAEAEKIKDEKGEDVYVLVGWRHAPGGPLPQHTPFIVVYDKENIRKNLHSRVKKYAEDMAREYGISDLNDSTEFAPKRLPFGGK